MRLWRCLLFPKLNDMGYIFLAITILAETAALLAMKAANGFTHWGWTVVAASTYLLSFIFLTLALRYLPAGIANAIWAGASTILVAIMGYFIFRESLSLVQVCCLILITVGILGLSLNPVPSKS